MRTALLATAALLMLGTGLAAAQTTETLPGPGTLCPDGSYVGSVGNSCAVTDPSTTIDTAPTSALPLPDPTPPLVVPNDPLNNGGSGASTASPYGNRGLSSPGGAPAVTSPNIN